MGKTTNGLLAAADMAVKEGEVNLEVVRKLHRDTAETLGLENQQVRHRRRRGRAYRCGRQTPPTPPPLRPSTRQAYKEVEELLDDCERTLGGVAMLRELSPRTRDRIVSYGERMSGRMVAAHLNGIGVPAQQVESWDLGIVTTSDFGDASVLDSCWNSVAGGIAKLPGRTVGVITGFIGKDADGAITTLGRGGSDLTACLIAAACGYDEVQVWKDVDGILTADPRLVDAAQPVPQVSFEEAAELAYFGAQVLHPVAMQPCIRTNVPVRVKNSYNPSAPGMRNGQFQPQSARLSRRTRISWRTHLSPPDAGTQITTESSDTELVTAITSKSNVVMVDVKSTRYRRTHTHTTLSHPLRLFSRNDLLMAACSARTASWLGSSPPSSDTSFPSM